MIEPTNIMPAPDIEEAIQNTNGEKPPKRPRGRPRNDGTPVGSPRESAPAGTRTRGRPPKRAKKNFERDIYDLIGLANGTLFGAELPFGDSIIIIKPALPEQIFGKDKLTEPEAIMLARSLNGVAQQNAVLYKFLNAFFNGEGINPYFMLAITGAGIAIPRLANHGLAPAVAGGVAQMVLAKLSGEMIAPIEENASQSDAANS